jgi:hypothetical protein
MACCTAMEPIVKHFEQHACILHVYTNLVVSRLRKTVRIMSDRTSYLDKSTIGHYVEIDIFLKVTSTRPPDAGYETPDKHAFF